MAKIVRSNEALNTEVDLKAPLNAPALVNPTINGVAQSGYTGFKNYIINGNFDVWQRGTSQTVTGYGSDDRYSNFNVGSTKTHSQVACSDTERALFNASKFSRTIVSSVAGASNVAGKLQLIEDITKLDRKTVTISFWVKADAAKNIAIEFYQVFGIGGTPSSTLLGISPQLVAITSTWQKKTITVTLPSIAGKTLGTDGVHTSATGVIFWFDAGSDLNSRAANLGQQSGTFDIAQVQLEEGSVATPFEQRPYGLELSLCQRYYEKSYDRNTDIGTATLIGAAQSSALTNWLLSAPAVKYNVRKRTSPTVTLYNPYVPNQTGNAIEFNYASVAVSDRAITTGVAIDINSETQLAIQAMGGVFIGGNVIVWHWTASAEL